VELPRKKNAARRSRQQPLRRAVDRLWKLEHHHCRPRPAPAAVPELMLDGFAKSHVVEKTNQQRTDGARALAVLLEFRRRLLHEPQAEI
jgi:hypothetical protein